MTNKEYATRMDINSLPGTTVIFDADGGYEIEKKNALSVLEVGKQYVVEYITIHSSSSDVKLVGYNGLFNTTMFASTDNAVSPEDQPSKCSITGGFTGNSSITSSLTFSAISPMRVASLAPVIYRLVLKKDGTTVLQGYFTWQEGFNKNGGEWKDIPTVEEE